MSAEQNVPEVQSHGGPPPSSDRNDSSRQDAGRQQDGNFTTQQDGGFNGNGGDPAFAGQSIPHGMGQSKSSRRRRRKRKGKGGSDGNPVESSGAQAQPEAGTLNSVQASASPQPASSNGGSSNREGGHHQNSGGTATGQRWKKKFRDRDRSRRDDSPGNQAGSNSSGPGNNGGGGSFANAGSNGAPSRDTHQFGNRVEGWKSRKGGGGSGGKQQRDRGPRSFVGPMDHSYRVANGNFLEAPPSTIESHGNTGGGRPRSYHTSNDSQPIDYSQGRVVPIADDAPTKIYFFIDDLFFVAKIQETARKLGVKVAFIKNEKEELAKLTGVEEEDRPGLIVFDLNNANAKPLTLIPKLKAKLKRSTSIVGFLSHIQGDLKAKAVEAGCDTVMPRAAFSQNLPNLLRRYGLEEEKEEANFNQ